MRRPGGYTEEKRGLSGRVHMRENWRGHQPSPRVTTQASSKDWIGDVGDITTAEMKRTGDSGWRVF